MMRVLYSFIHRRAVELDEVSELVIKCLVDRRVWAGNSRTRGWQELEHVGFYSVSEAKLSVVEMNILEGLGENNCRSVLNLWREIYSRW